MTLCTLALGDRHQKLSSRLQESLPVEISICTEIPPDFAPARGDGRHDYHHKRYVIEQCYDPDGTLFLDADAICVNQAEFLGFLRSLEALRPGIYSPYVYSSYGFKHARVPDERVDRTRLAPLLRFFDSVIELSEEDLFAFRMPYEWLMFFRFESLQQKDAFFDHYRQLHAILITSECVLSAECNVIGLSALRCKLPVVELKNVAGIRHKK
jgi:hypothetical protein